MIKTVPQVMTIAGSDSGGGAGIQADIKTLNSISVYGSSVITCVTAQNSKFVNEILRIPDKTIENQINTVMSDFKIKNIKLVVTDIDGVPGDPSTFYVSGADGGIFKTINGGVSFKPIFENQRAYSIGALSIAPSDNNIIWVGTGEGDPRNSVGYGWGVYKSIDGGMSWNCLLYTSDAADE